MERKAIFSPSQFYHLYNHANGVENIFNKHQDYSNFLNRYLFRLNGLIKTYAFVLMPNHFHLVIKTNTVDETLTYFRNKKLIQYGFNDKPQAVEEHFNKIIRLELSHFFNGYVQSHNRSSQRRGSLFQQNLKRKFIPEEGDLRNVIKYVHRNPIHHAFCDTLEEWPYNSYKYFEEDEESPIEKEAVLELFGGKNLFFEIHNTLGGLPSKGDPPRVLV